MYRPTDPQSSLLETAQQLPEAARARLRRSWALPFALHILPLLMELEDLFAELYGRTGNPNFSVARKLALLVLQAMFDLDDQRLLDAMSFDIRFQYALGLPADDAYLSRRAFVAFRSDLVAYDPEGKLLERVFDTVRDAMIEHFDAETGVQRLDSTHVVSNIRRVGLQTLLRQTLSQFLRRLAKQRSAQYSAMPESLRTWHAEESGKDESWFGASQERGADKAQLAGWLFELEQRYRDDHEVGEWEEYQLITRVLDGHFERPEPDPEPDGGIPRSEKVLIEKKSSGDAPQSAYDDGAAKGHKGVGYSVHIAETVGNTDTPEILTGFAVYPANEVDQNKAIELLQTLAESELQPRRLLADAGYCPATALYESHQAGTELWGPTPRFGYPADYLGRDHFEFDQEGLVLKCPAKHEPLYHAPRKYGGEVVPHAVFSKEHCDTCPLRTRCAATQNGVSNWFLPLTPALLLRDRRLSEQTTTEFGAVYRMRAGIEATASELKRAHGMRKLRVRGRARVRLAVATALIACNVKRWTKAA